MPFRKIKRNVLAATLTAACVAAGAWAAPSANAIVGGAVAEQPYPWMVNLAAGPEDAWHLCGASMVTDRWAVTAAHCVTDVEVSDPLARVGSNDRTRGGQERRLSRIVVHPAYKEGSNGPTFADLALVELDAPVDTAPVAIARTAPAPGTRARLLGWGNTCREATPACSRNPVPLHQLDTQVNAPGDCRPGTLDPATELCVGDLSGATGGCQGDSGGPQVVPAGYGRWLLTGVTSRDGGVTVDCNLGIYTSVATYADWIDDTVGARR